MFKYQKVVKEVRQNIIDGIYKNNRLPSKKELATAFDVSIITINKVLEILKDEELIEIKHGSGIYIKYDFNLLLHSEYQSCMHGFKTKSKNLNYHNILKKFEIIKATVFLANNLKIKPGDLVYEIIRCRVIKGEISQYEKTYLPVAMFPNITEDHLLDSLYEYIINECNLKIDHTHDIVSCKNANVIDKTYLEIDYDTALGTLEQIGWLDNGEIFQYSYCVYLPKYFQFKHVSPF